MPPIIKKSLTVIIIFALILSIFGCESGYAQYDGTIFSSTMTLSIKASGVNARKAIDEMIAVSNEIDKSVNLSRNDSYLTAFNDASANQEVEVDKHAYELFVTAKNVYEQTDGAFNPTLAPLSKEWCVDNEGISEYGNGDKTPPSLPDESQLNALRPLFDLSAITAKEENGKYYLKKTLTGVKLDFGGIAKGYCADLFREIAVKNGVDSALIAVSGNIVTVGKNLTTDKPWTVGINNPRRNGNDKFVCGFYCSDNTVVTSGDYERYYLFDGLRITHILDGETLTPISVSATVSGYSPKNSWVSSCTVIGESSMLADAYSTAVSVMGVEKGARFLAERGYKGVIFTSDYKYETVGEIEFVPSASLYQKEYQPL